MVPEYFSRDSSTDSFSCRERKTGRKKDKKRQQIKKGKSKRCCRCQSTWLIIAPLSHRYRSAVAPLSLHCCSVVALLSHRYRTAIALLSFRCRSATVAPLSRFCRTAIAPVLLHCRSNDVAPAVATQLHRYCTAIAPLLLRCCRSCCRYAVALSIASVVAPLSRRCRTAVAPLSLLLLCCRCCQSCCRKGITAAIDPAVTHGRLLKRQNQGNGFPR